MGKLITEIVLATVVFCGIFSVAWHVCKRWYFKTMPKHIKTVKDIRKAGEEYDEQLRD
jgi:hypothetical protein